MHRNMTGVVALFLILAGGQRTGVLTGVSSNSVPAEARTRAAQVLEERWKPLAVRNPAFLRLEPGAIDTTEAVLGQAFVEYILDAEDVATYASSGTDDPRLFASARIFTFPVLVRGESMGSIMIRANVDDRGLPFDETQGNYMFLALTPRGNKIEDELLRIRSKFGRDGAHNVSWVRFMEGAEPLYVVTAPDGNSMVATDSGAKLEPLSAVARRIKPEIRSRTDGE